MGHRASDVVRNQTMISCSSSALESSWLLFTEARNG